MKDFRSYRQGEEARRASEGASGKTAGEKAEYGGAGGAGTMPLEGEAAELARKALSAYNGKSESSVLGEIVRQAEKMKRAGTLSNAELDAFYAQFSPMLDGGQRKKFRSVIERLKKL